MGFVLQILTLWVLLPKCWFSWCKIKQFTQHHGVNGINIVTVTNKLWAGYRSRYSDWLRAGRTGDRILVEARFSAPVQTGPGARPPSCTMGTRSFQGVKSGRGVTLTPHPLLVPWSWKGRAIPLLPLWAVRPVQRLIACTRVHFTFLPNQYSDNNYLNQSQDSYRTQQPNGRGTERKTKSQCLYAWY